MHLTFTLTPTPEPLSRYVVGLSLFFGWVRRMFAVEMPVGLVEGARLSVPFGNLEKKLG